MSKEEITLRDRAKAVISLLEKAGGDVEVFARKFAPQETTQVSLTRAFVVLSEPGNESEMNRWELLVSCYDKAKMAITKKRQMEALAEMPVPDTDTSLQTWLAFAKHFGTEFTEEAKGKGKAQSKKSDKPVIPDEIKLLLEQLSA